MQVDQPLHNGWVESNTPRPSWTFIRLDWVWIHAAWCMFDLVTLMNLPWLQKPIWLVVEPTPLKHININPNGNLPQIGVKEQNIWNHHLARYNTVHAFYICLQSKERIFWGALSKNKFWKRIFLVERMQTVRHPFRITWNKETSNSHFLGWNPQNNDTKLYFLLVSFSHLLQGHPNDLAKKTPGHPPLRIPRIPNKVTTLVQCCFGLC